jgi:hypothetical protein
MRRLNSCDACYHPIQQVLYKDVKINICYDLDSSGWGQVPLKGSSCSIKYKTLELLGAGSFLRTTQLNEVSCLYGVRKESNSIPGGNPLFLPFLTNTFNYMRVVSVLRATSIHFVKINTSL